MSKEWKNYLVTGVIAIIAVVFVYPVVRPFAQRLPLIGKYL